MSFNSLGRAVRHACAAVMVAVPLTAQSPAVPEPAGTVFVQLSPSWNWSQDEAQYVTTVKDPTATTFGGSRYVFGAAMSSSHARTASTSPRAARTIKPTPATASEPG